MQLKNNKRAFTLMEIITVVIIVGVLASLALPRLVIVIERVRMAEGISILNTLLAAQKRFDMENGSIDRVYKDGTGGSNQLANGDLDVDIPVSRNFDQPFVYNNTAQVALVQRSTGEYTIEINDQGNITCTDTGTGICLKMGY